MAAIQKQRSNKMTITCRSEQLTRQPSNVSNYEGYHGGEAASVPFTWESQPGTPKVRFRGTTLPPLTPPPSYSYTATATTTIKAHKKISSSKPANLFQTIFPKRLTSRKARVPPPPPSPASSYPSLSSSSSSSSSSCNSFSPVRLRSRSVPSSPMRCPRKLDQDREKEEDLYDVPVSGLCFGNARSRGCYSSMIKKVLLGDFLWDVVDCCNVQGDVLFGSC